MDPAQTLLGLQPAPGSLNTSPGAVKCSGSVVYRESCLWRGYVPKIEDLHNLLLLSVNRQDLVVETDSLVN